MRRIRPLLVVLGLLLALAVAADFGVAYLATGQVRSTLAASEKFGDRPQVEIGGFPFLTQLVAREFDRMDVSGTDVPAPGDLRISQLRVRLRGVTFDGMSASSVRVRQLDGDAVVAYRELNKLLERRALTVASAGGDRIRLTGKRSLLGRRVEVGAEGRLVPGESGVGFEPSGYTVNGVPASTAMTRQLRRGFAVELELPVSFAGVRVDRITPDANGVDFHLVGSDVALSG